ncbi:helix-turn-helix domain-containing protein [Nonomuraea endophytica]|uniref:Transcriptional regulator with XRE-family HTH domain n=1 Tax=Nonomuraea endophytica TaxID=714136 RepID=A0A7W8EDP1_9ACTN|nr:helix-turn-helix transcriptional regulator [Nonomuraea endophytica]MBB5075491.1 transcriptional regulator with XRE-family HTH domain [Nonomuraea endophytica]
MDARREIGEKIARARRRRGLSQAVLAGLVGRSESWLSQVERGQRDVSNHAVITALAEILGLSVDDLATKKSTTMTRYEAATGIRQAMLGYDGLSAMIDHRLAGGSVESILWLRHEIRQVNRLYQATRYDEVGKRLPRLIIATELGSRHAPSRGRRAYHSLRSLTYHCTTTTLRRVGEPELAWVAADRSLAAAQAAERPLLAAVSAYRLGYVLVRLREISKALEVVRRAGEALRRTPGARTRPVLGGLHLVAVTAAAAAYDQAGIRQHLDEARQVAETLGEDRNDFWTAFGMTNVIIHEISAAADSGDSRTAIAASERLDLSTLAPGLVGRRSQIHLDLARAYAVQRKDAASVNMLLEAERLSPELVRYGGRPRDLLTQLLKREHRASTPQLRPLAQRAGII